ncbi:MAG: homocysteine S-methyltransferase family protein [Chloroflexota bacterium]
MNRYAKLWQRIQAGEKVIIDGATGTEVERRGVPQIDQAWNGGGTVTHPEIVQQIHADYIEHGAEIVISNTFATGKHNLQDAGWSDQFDLLNRNGVTLAQAARAKLNKPDVLVAGGISHWSWGVEPTLEQLRQNISEQAAIMADAGADLIMLEMMSDLPKVLVLIEAAQTAGLPVWVGLSCHLREDGTPVLLFGDVSLADALDALKKYDIPLISIMHTEVDYIDTCLDVVDEKWQGPVGVYAHSSFSIETGTQSIWVFDGVISPDAYAAYSEGWLKRGVQVIGGCCGVGVPHIKRLNRLVAATSSS